MNQEQIYKELSDQIAYLSTELQVAEYENALLRRCASKYLSQLGIKNISGTLSSDIESIRIPGG